MPGTTQIERWIYVTGTDAGARARRRGLLRAHRAGRQRRCVLAGTAFVPIKNRPPDRSGLSPPRELVSPDALALVRFGLRAADDPRIRNTVQRRSTPC